MKLLLKIGVVAVVIGMLWLAITEGDDQISGDQVITAPVQPAPEINVNSLLDQLKQARNEQDTTLLNEMQSLKGADKAILVKKLQAHDNEGNTPLLVAVYRDFIGVVPQILAALQEAELDIRHQHNFKYNTVLHVARTKPMIDLLIPYMTGILEETTRDAEVLQNKPDGNSPLFLARTSEIAESLETSKFPLHVSDETNNKNQTPLMFMVSAPSLDYTPMEGVEIMPPPTSSDEAQKRKESENQTRREIANNFIMDAIKNDNKSVKVSGESTPIFEVKDLDGNTIFHLLAKSNLDPAIIVELIENIKKNYGENNDAVKTILADKNNAQQTARDIAEASTNKDTLDDVINALSYT